MRFECSRDDITRAILVPASVIPVKTTKQSLQAIRLTVTADSVSMEASDGDLWARRWMRPESVTSPGEVALPGSTFETIVRSVEGKSVAIESQGRFCEVRCEDSLYNLVAIDAADFPLPAAAGRPKFTVSRLDLDQMFQRASVAVGRDVGRYAVNGIMFEYDDQTLSLIATDSRRLARTTRRASPLLEPGKTERVIVPVKAIHELLRGTGDEETISVAFDSDFVTFMGNSLSITARLIVGDFPDHKKIVPQEHVGTIRVSRDALASAVRKTAVFATEMMTGIHLDVADGHLTLSAEADGRGRANTRISCELRGAQQLAIDLNPDFLLDHLKVVPSGMLSLEFRDPQSAIVVREDGSQDIYLVMPITTS